MCILGWCADQKVFYKKGKTFICKKARPFWKNLIEFNNLKIIDFYRNYSKHLWDLIDNEILCKSFLKLEYRIL